MTADFPAEMETCRSKPKLSIIIPTYGTTGVLGECLRALSEQTGNADGCEVLVVNDGGRGSEAFEVPGQNLRIRYLRQDHKGPAAARNLGTRMAGGEIVAFLDDDSVPLKNWLDATMSAWMDTPDCDGIGGYVASDPGESIYCRVNADFFNWYLDQQGPDGECLFLVTCNAGYKKSSLERIGGFDDRFERACGEDRDLNLKIVRGGGKLRLDKRILVYHDRDLTLRSFAKKHYHYGKAASRIYSRYPDLKHISTGGYRSLFRSVWCRHHKISDRALAMLLVTLSQIATVVGFLAGLLSSNGIRKDPAAAHTRG